MALQYVQQMDNMRSNNDNKVSALQAQLDKVLKQLQLSEDINSSKLNSKKNNTTKETDVIKDDNNINLADEEDSSTNSSDNDL